MKKEKVVPKIVAAVALAICALVITLRPTEQIVEATAENGGKGNSVTLVIAISLLAIVSMVSAILSIRHNKKITADEADEDD